MGERVTYGLCWFAPFDPGQDCEPYFDGTKVKHAHLIDQQRLKRLGLDPTDRRTWKWGCGAHHHRFDHHFFRIRRDQLPPAVEEYAAENDITWSLERDYE